MKSLQGYLLIASPQMQDPHFAGTVVLLVHHGSDGAVGVVLNRPLGQVLSKLWQQLTSEPCPVDRHLHFGGPVAGPVLAVHRSKSLGEAQISPGLYVAASHDRLQQLVRRGNQPFRLFIGYAGWSRGQLEAELERGDWMTLPARADDVFGDQGDLWGRLVRQYGRSLIKRVLGITHLPKDATLN